MTTTSSHDYDCIIVGAGPGGLQAANHLARFNRRVVLFDQGGGRTRHALHLENYLGVVGGSGKNLIDTGLQQIQSFGVEWRREPVTAVRQNGGLLASTGQAEYRSPYLIVSSGGTEKLPSIKNLNRFFARSVFTCVDCDGYHTIGKKLVILGHSLETVRLALAMRQMFTPDITLIMPPGQLPDDHAELLAEDEIKFYEGTPQEFIGESVLSGVKLTDGREFPGQVVMLSYGYTINDSYLAGLPLQREAGGRKLATDHLFETSVKNLFAVGALKAGNAQAIIAAGQGAMVGIEINRRLLEL